MAEATPTFIWYELMTPDPEAAKAFYARVVGWEAEDLGGPHSGYSLLKAGGVGVAGVMGLPTAECAHPEPGWFGYVAVQDTDAAAARIEQAGGRILRAPADIPEIGRFAVVADPTGAAFMLMTPLPRDDVPPAVPPMTLGRVGWHELLAGDGEAAFAFYADQFGWAESSVMDMGPMGNYRLWSAGGEPIGGMMTKPAEHPRPEWNFYFVVDAIDAAAARIVEAGGRITDGPMEVPGEAWIVTATDPQGISFAVVAAAR